MKHYIDSNDKIFAFESDGSQDHLIKSDMQPISKEEIAERNKPTKEQLAEQVSGIRKQKEAEGVTVNSIRYAGDEENRQHLNEAIQFADDAGDTTFEIWKDSDGKYHPAHPLADVRDAYRAIGRRRVKLIGLEAQYTQQVLAGEVTNIKELDWSTEYDTQGEQVE